MQRRAFRQQILNVSIEDLKRVAAQYLKPELASIAAVTSVEKAKGLADQFEVIAL